MKFKTLFVDIVGERERQRRRKVRDLQRLHERSNKEEESIAAERSYAISSNECSPGTSAFLAECCLEISDMEAIKQDTNKAALQEVIPEQMGAVSDPAAFMEMSEHSKIKDSTIEERVSVSLRSLAKGVHINNIESLNEVPTWDIEKNPEKPRQLSMVETPGDTHLDGQNVVQKVDNSEKIFLQSSIVQLHGKVRNEDDNTSNPADQRVESSPGDLSDDVVINGRFPIVNEDVFGNLSHTVGSGCENVKATKMILCLPIEGESPYSSSPKRQNLDDNGQTSSHEAALGIRDDRPVVIQDAVSDSERETDDRPGYEEKGTILRSDNDKQTRLSREPSCNNGDEAPNIDQGDNAVSNEDQSTHLAHFSTRSNGLCMDEVIPLMQSTGGSLVPNNVIRGSSVYSRKTLTGFTDLRSRGLCNTYVEANWNSFATCAYFAGSVLALWKSISEVLRKYSSQCKRVAIHEIKYLWEPFSLSECLTSTWGSVIQLCSEGVGPESFIDIDLFIHVFKPTAWRSSLQQIPSSLMLIALSTSQIPEISTIHAQAYLDGMIEGTDCENWDEYMIKWFSVPLNTPLLRKITNSLMQYARRHGPRLCLMHPSCSMNLSQMEKQGIDGVTGAMYVSNLDTQSGLSFLENSSYGAQWALLTQLKETDLSVLSAAGELVHCLRRVVLWCSNNKPGCRIYAFSQSKKILKKLRRAWPEDKSRNDVFYVTDLGDFIESGAIVVLVDWSLANDYIAKLLSLWQTQNLLVCIPFINFLGAVPDRASIAVTLNTDWNVEIAPCHEISSLACAGQSGNIDDYHTIACGEQFWFSSPTALHMIHYATTHSKLFTKIFVGIRHTAAIYSRVVLSKWMFITSLSIGVEVSREDNSNFGPWKSNKHSDCSELCTPEVTADDSQLFVDHLALALPIVRYHYIQNILSQQGRRTYLPRDFVMDILKTIPRDVSSQIRLRLPTIRVKPKLDRRVSKTKDMLKGRKTLAEISAERRRAVKRPLPAKESPSEEINKRYRSTERGAESDVSASDLVVFPADRTPAKVPPLATSLTDYWTDLSGVFGRL